MQLNNTLSGYSSHEITSIIKYNLTARSTRSNIPHKIFGYDRGEMSFFIKLMQFVSRKEERDYIHTKIFPFFCFPAYAVALAPVSVVAVTFSISILGIAPPPKSVCLALGFLV